MKTQKFIALIAVAFMIISVFLSWIEVESSATVLGQKAFLSLGGITGVQTTAGIIGLVFSVIGGILVLFQNRIGSIVVGVLNVLNGLGHAASWSGFIVSTRVSFSGDGFSSEASWSLQIGMYLFLISSVVFLIGVISNENSRQSVEKPVETVPSSITLDENSSSANIFTTVERVIIGVFSLLLLFLFVMFLTA